MNRLYEYPAPCGTLMLYYRESCYYCVLVRRTIERLGIAVELRNITQEPQFARELFEARRRTTVPVLRGTCEGTDWWMPESLDIIRYLEKHFAASRI